ncbi:MAG: hypothetical protein HZA51_16745 [Planctomycetes bacterium]|nr:hypothetical protein [Planctomycetota bacterium]
MCAFLLSCCFFMASPVLGQYPTELCIPSPFLSCDPACQSVVPVLACPPAPTAYVAGGLTIREGRVAPDGTDGMNHGQNASVAIDDGTGANGRFVIAWQTAEELRDYPNIGKWNDEQVLVPRLY